MVGNYPTPVARSCSNRSYTRLVLGYLAFLVVTIAACIRPVHQRAAVPTAQSTATATETELHIAVINGTAFDNPRDLRPCQNSDDKVISIVRALDGAVDAVVAGHTHVGVAHFVGDTPIVQSFSGGLAFGRLDLGFRRQGGRWQLDRRLTQVYPPTEVCEVTLPERSSLESPSPRLNSSAALTKITSQSARAVTPDKSLQGSPSRHSMSRCEAQVRSGTNLRRAQYEGRQVVASPLIAAALKPHLERAQARSESLLGVTLAARVHRNRHEESALAQLMADLIRSGASQVAGKPIDIGLQNGGVIRNDLPSGPLKYGHVFEVQPFDDTLAIVRLSGAQLIEMFRRSMSGNHGVLVPSGLQVEAHCRGSELVVQLQRESGEPIDPQRTYSLAMSDFLATGGNSFAGLTPPAPTTSGTPNPVTLFNDVVLRALIVEELKQYRGTLPSGQMQPQRLILPAQRPLHWSLVSG